MAGIRSVAPTAETAIEPLTEEISAQRAAIGRAYGERLSIADLGDAYPARARSDVCAVGVAIAPTGEDIHPAVAVVVDTIATFLRLRDGTAVIVQTIGKCVAVAIHTVGTRGNTDFLSAGRHAHTSVGPDVDACIADRAFGRAETVWIRTVCQTVAVFIEEIIARKLEGQTRRATGWVKLTIGIEAVGLTVAVVILAVVAYLRARDTTGGRSGTCGIHAVR